MATTTTVPASPLLERAEELHRVIATETDPARLAVLLRAVEAERARAERALEPRIACDGPYAGGSWSPHRPHAKQRDFLFLDEREALYGGAAGGGKSDSLLMAALQYVCVPGYAALLLRQSYPQLVMSEGLMPRAEEWLAPTGARYIASERQWEFPSGATLMFRHLSRDAERFDLAGGAWQFIGWDELTNWPSDVAYTFMFSRLRRLIEGDDDAATLPRCPHCGLSGADVPLRMRAATNPGSSGGQWVYNRIIAPWKAWEEAGRSGQLARPFIPARITDNPSLDVNEYVKSLAELDPVTRAQLMEGDWEIRPQGKMLKAEWFEIVDDWPRVARLVRRWDLAATEVDTTGKSGKASDPDWTVGALVGLHDGRWWLIDVERFRKSPHETDLRMKQVAELDREAYGKRVAVRVEQEPGASGKRTIDDLRRRVFVGYDFDGVGSSSSKADRARPLASAAEAGNFKLMRAEWNAAWLEEAVLFPSPDNAQGVHDDQIDAVSGAMEDLSTKRKGRLRA